LGIDHYSPSSGTVESFKWDVPPEDWEGDVPVSDYSSQVLRDGTSFVVFGGQTTMGDMVAMDKVLVFNTELRQWYTKVSPLLSLSFLRPRSKKQETDAFYEGHDSIEIRT